MKSKYIKPFAECHPCIGYGLLQESEESLPFDPTNSTTEALGNEADFADEEINEFKVKNLWTQE